MTHRKGTTVQWNWGQGTGEGKIVEVHTDKVTRTISGSEITRNGSKETPAYLIEQADGQRVLKLDSEVSTS
ncbi:MAG: DUF2945 domain-containing protein [Rhodococcus sp. (in: high G+C Gram-positive bacteria)]|jgi:hypothetical protein|uniref:DUF2945 domain-containing protein n=1 Tax=Rhodococcus sp. EPR-157 TaxID=1813677 RepID=UPI0007BC2747|nr:DUF2945 domain-containing protein [Rhodococcus sp. EPR-157]KZF09566.1 hypothetical protein A2J03_02215 [Rhodococcus sp. EPR-157]